MKKLFLTLALFATLLFTACQKEEVNPNAGSAVVTFSVEVPSTPQTRAIQENGENINDLVYAVYRTTAQTEEEAIANMGSNTLVYQINPGSTVFTQEGKTSVSIELLNDQNYVILFWAQVNDAWVSGTNFDLTNITYPATMNANNQNLAAFSGVSFITGVDGARSESITLTRPFAQINIGTTLPENFIVTFSGSDLKVTNAAAAFNVATQKSSGSTNLTFAKAAIPGDNLTVNSQNYSYVGMNYLFANENVTVEYNIVTTSHGTVNNTIDNVPVKQNYKTNIIGNLLTSNTTYEITLDDEWGTPEHVISDGWRQTGVYEYTITDGATSKTLKEVLNHADAQAKAAATKSEGPEVTINLSADVEWETGAGGGSTPLLPEDSPISAVVINGNGKTFTATGAGVGQIRLANGALLTLNNVKLVDKSVSYAEDSWEYGYLEFAGKLAFNECEVVNAIMIEGENAAFTGCTFNSNHDNEYDVWVNNGTASFSTCTFSGYRGLKIHEDYGSEVISVSVDNCTFGPLVKKPGIAIGTVNAATSISIKNSLFNKCQPGDQGLYIYETKTDVTSFTFECANNTVIPAGDEVVEQEDETVIVSTVEGLKKAINEAEDGRIICLADGKYDGLFQVGGRSITLKSYNPKGAELSGRISVAGGISSTFTCENLKLSVSDNTNSAFGNQYYDKGKGYIIGIYCGNVVVSNCEFSGMTDDFGAISYHSYSQGANTQNLEKLTVDGCKFIGGRAIRARSNVSVTNCEFEGLINPCLQIMGLGDNDIESNVIFTKNRSNENISGVCIKTSNYPTKNITFKVSENTNCNIISFDSKNLSNLYPETYTYTGEVKTLVPEDGKGLIKLLAYNNINDITLLPGTIYDLDDVQYVKHVVTLNGDASNKPTIKGKIVAENTFSASNIKFGVNSITNTEIATGTYGTYVNNGNPIVVAHKSSVTLNGCEFDGSNDYNAGINYFNNASNEVLKVNGCTFTNSYIYSKTLCIVTNNTFNLGGCPYAICIWPCSDGTNNICEFTGNTIQSNYNDNKAYCYVMLLSQSVPYRNTTFNVQNNSGLTANVYNAVNAVNAVINNPNTGVANDGTVVFANGSKKFKINANGTFGGDIVE